MQEELDHIGLGEELRHRGDFVMLVRALTARNEPEVVPEAMGACLVKGLADWERVGAYRSAWERRLGRAASEEEWSAEMAANLAPRKDPASTPRTTGIAIAGSMYPRLR